MIKVSKLTLRSSSFDSLRTAGLKVCIDTNVIISAEVFGGVCDEVLDLVIERKIKNVTSLFILIEVAKVLDKKFEKGEDEIKETLSLIADISTLVKTKTKIRALSYNPDNEILACATEGKVDYLVTGDKKHLLKLKEYKGIKILSPAQFLKAIVTDKQKLERLPALLKSGS